MLAFAPLDGAVRAAATVLSGLTDLLTPVAGTHATAAAVVVLTVLLRLAITPLTLAQVRGERHRAALAPRMRDLQRRYGSQPDRLRAELAALYRDAGASPFAGCLPALLQAPFFLLMYTLFSTAPPGGALFGVPLGHHLADGLGGGAGAVFGALAVLLALLAWLFSRRAKRGAVPAGGEAGEVVAGLLGRVVPVLPFLTVPALGFVPLAAGLYLVTTTAWTALEHLVLRRPPHPLTNMAASA